ncbi:hypothetical protein LZZ98_05165 [Acinetobacter sp. SM34]|uniref:hypothetical protein n=1 Tax=Acinetobacter sp. SM34 TaxID=1301620 RepID=UPI001EDC59C5|nr:hypothetical protein [Acinetobacter sp. SM34]MCG2607929.1 hypothetical protein [Acinetobacter sp. SM34]
MELTQKELIDKFNDLLTRYYNGKLINFCEDFDTKDRESFYKKIQKSRNRMLKQNVNEATLDEFRKYIFFMEGKILEETCTFEEKKALQIFKSLL